NIYMGPNVSAGGYPNRVNDYTQHWAVNPLGSEYDFSITWDPNNDIMSETTNINGTDYSMDYNDVTTNVANLTPAPVPTWNLLKIFIANRSQGAKNTEIIIKNLILNGNPIPDQDAGAADAFLNYYIGGTFAQPWTLTGTVELSGDFATSAELAKIEIITGNIDNQLPIAVSNNYNTFLNTSVTLTPLAGDSDSDALQTLSVFSINGTVLSYIPSSIQNISVTNGTVTVTYNNLSIPNFIFTPDNNFTGTVNIPYAITDGYAGGACAEQIIEVLAQTIDAPIPTDNNYSTIRDLPITLNPLEGDIDSADLPLTLVSINGENLNYNPNSTQEIILGDGKIEITYDNNSTPTILFIPNEGFTGTVEFEYEISNGFLTSSARQIIAMQAPDCIDNSYIPQKLVVDGNAKSLFDFVKDALNIRNKYESNNCKSLNKSTRSKLVNNASDLYNKIWTDIWTAVPTYDGINNLGCICTATNYDLALNTIEKDSNRLKRLVNRHLKNSCIDENTKDSINKKRL
ncbi:MAG: hypothetical protein KC414_13320, partial [Romboutsia sp.]|nr:hypothetical protein [Romboutsia sp.]